MVNIILSSEQRKQLGVVLWAQASCPGDPMIHFCEFTWASSQVPTQLLSHLVGQGQNGKNKSEKTGGLK